MPRPQGGGIQLTPHFVNAHSYFFPKSTVMGVKGEKSDFALEKSGKHHLSQVSNVKISSDSWSLDIT